ncbi:hypothetical protein PhCBS80983_g04944 [Powellomyces hirtus]|uniref:Polynucleotide kinase 3'-phosphatase n=1 Tax=Powellomyces hirtus TaxID=109895 RepID=A0A507DWJ8_9FUNG|nr:hypothetical protein PhCBS80983_g04944 [Powellomyces hirtus]
MTTKRKGRDEESQSEEEPHSCETMILVESDSDAIIVEPFAPKRPRNGTASMDGTDSKCNTTVSETVVQVSVVDKQATGKVANEDTKLTTASTTVTTTSTTTTSSTTSSKPPVHPFFTQNLKSPSTIPLLFNSLGSVKWTQASSILIATFGAQTPRAKIAAFDFDGTISTVKGTHTHAKHADDWRFFDASIPERLATLHYEEGYRVVFFSNQKDICKANQNKRKIGFMGRIENVMNAMHTHAKKKATATTANPDIHPPPVLVFAAVADDWNRKPRPGMWETFERDHNGTVPVDRAASFYVGDAAGRLAGHRAGAKKDFADTDYKFARNVGCAFYTPEQFFKYPSMDALRAADPLPPHVTHHSHLAPTPLFDPREYLRQYRDNPPPAPPSPSAPAATPELILAVGSPASGKTTYCKRHYVNNPAMHTYVHVNQDTLKSRDKCLRATEDALAEGKSVVVDNTNPDAATRRLYFAAAARAAAKRASNNSSTSSISNDTVDPIPVTCLYFTADQDLCQHNNVYRAYMSARDQEGRWEDHPHQAAPTAKSTSSTTKRNGKTKTAPPPSDSHHPSTPPSPPIPRLPTMAFRSFTSRLEPPTMQEGYVAIIHIPFVPRFATHEEEHAWGLFFV